MNVEQDILVQCPYCFKHITVRIDSTAGRNQEFVYDCEVCCRPIDMKATMQESQEQFYLECSISD